MEEHTLTLKPIGIIHSCFKEKFGAPRQSGLVPSANGVIELLPPYSDPNSIKELDGFSHIWLSFNFHQIDNDKKWAPMVRPPGLGGNKKVGVFATRSPFRPNNMGLSLVKLDKVEIENGKAKIHVKGIDLIDGTPIYDIKPYMPEVESVPTAKAGWTENLPKKKCFDIIFSEKVQEFCNKNELHGIENLTQLISEFLQLDPRPAYYQDKEIESDKTYFGAKLYNIDVHWEVKENVIHVTDVFQKDEEEEEEEEQ
jgi:tRNA (adenine37-N6)-methyltransferase